jgi:hypothetical protein
MARHRTVHVQVKPTKRRFTIPWLSSIIQRASPAALSLLCVTHSKSAPSLTSSIHLYLRLQTPQVALSDRTIYKVVPLFFNLNLRCQLYQLLAMAVLHAAAIQNGRQRSERHQGREGPEVPIAHLVSRTSLVFVGH